MANRKQAQASGFSLVELMVALVFIGFLMAGMSNVFKSSVTVLSTSSEGLSSVRRNRMSIDLLYDDLNNAGLFLSNLSSPPSLSPANPSFYIIPNVTIPGAAADDPASADQVFFYLDDPLPFEGTLVSTGGGAAGESKAFNLDEAVVKGQNDITFDAPPVTDKLLTIDCKDASYANMMKLGHNVVLKDEFDNYHVVEAPTVSGTTVTVKYGADPLAAVTGEGDAGTAHSSKHLIASDVTFYRPAQMVRYSVKMKLFDPQKATGVPCLVRDQGTYNAAGFVADASLEAIVAENVSGFKAYLSADSGQNWAGYGRTYTGFDNGWTAGIRAELDTQLSTAGRAGYQTTAGDDNWIRSIPSLVRLDITTRTAVKRPENRPVNEPLATPLYTPFYKEFTQSLVLVPRHFGLPMSAVK